MSFFGRSILKPSESVMASVATVGTVYAIYSLSIGSVAEAHASPANLPVAESARKKAGYTAFGVVSALFLITKDANIATLGYGSVIAMEIAYRHGIMASPDTGKIQQPGPAAYQPAQDQNVIPFDTVSTGTGY